MRRTKLTQEIKFMISSKFDSTESDRYSENLKTRRRNILWIYGHIVSEKRVPFNQVSKHNLTFPFPISQAPNNEKKKNKR